MTRRASCDCDRLGRSRDDECVHADPCPADPLITEAPARLAEIRETLFTGGYDGTEGDGRGIDSTWTDFGEALGIADRLADALVVERQALQDAANARNQLAEALAFVMKDYNVPHAALTREQSDALAGSSDTVIPK